MVDGSPARGLERQQAAESQGGRGRRPWLQGPRARARVGATQLLSAGATRQSTSGCAARPPPRERLPPPTLAPIRRSASDGPACAERGSLTYEWMKDLTQAGLHVSWWYLLGYSGPLLEACRS